jgi:dephospho-CoA kinase
MKWIGLTGGIATGKSTVSKILRDIGIAVIDADILAREVTKPGSKAIEEIKQAFGSEMVGADGNLDRSRLGRVVFKDQEKLKKLETILHPKIQELRSRERLKLEQAGHALAFYDVPLLFEKNMQSEFDAVLLVYAPPEDQRRRLQERDNLSDAEIELRMKAQIPIDEKVKMAQYVILNNGSVADLKLNVQSILKDLVAKL